MLEKTAVQYALTEIIEERVQKVAWNKAKQDKIYIEANKKQTIALQLLNESITTDRQRHLLDDLESAWNFAEGIMQEYAYRQGIRDSRMIHRELKEFGIFVAEEDLTNE